jgi:hypothetical protein
VSTLAGPAVAAYPVLSAEQRRTLIQRVSNVVNERIWDPAFQRDPSTGAGRVWWTASKWLNLSSGWTCWCGRQEIFCR